MALPWSLLTTALVMASLVHTGLAVSPCAWDPSLSLYWSQASACVMNRDWLIAHPPKSTYAVADLKTFKYYSACAKHDVSDGSRAAMEACNADTANYCYVSAGFTPDGIEWTCTTGGERAIWVNIVCKNSIYQKYYKCQARQRATCTQDPECVLTAEPARFNTPDGWAKINNASNGLAYKWGFCYPKESGADKWTKPTDWNDWYAESYGSSDPKVYLSNAGRGNCSYAQKAYKRVLLDTKCNSIGDYDFSVSYMEGNDTKVAAAYNPVIQCLQTKDCDVSFIPAEYNDGAPFAYCEVDGWTRTSTGLWSKGLDAKWLAALKACEGDRTVRFDKARCLAVKV